MGDTEFVVNNMAYTNDELYNTNTNADELNDFENTKTDLNNCLYEALTKKLQPCQYYQPGQKMPAAQKEIKLFVLYVNIRSLQRNLNNLNHELGYQPVILANSQTNAGGVGVYVTDKLTVTPLGKNELNSNCKDSWLKISNKI